MSTTPCHQHTYVVFYTKYAGHFNWFAKIAALPSALLRATKATNKNALSFLAVGNKWHLLPLVIALTEISATFITHLWRRPSMRHSAGSHHIKMSHFHKNKSASSHLTVQWAAALRISVRVHRRVVARCNSGATFCAIAVCTIGCAYPCRL